MMDHLFTYGPVPVDEAEQVSLKESEVGPVPERWRMVELQEVAKISTGSTPSTKRPDYYQGATPFVKTTEIVNNIIDRASVHVSDAAVADYRLKIYEPGAIFLAMYGQGKTRGQVSLLNTHAATTQNTGAITPEEALNSTYLWLYLMSRYDALRGDGIHGQISHLNLSYVRQLQIPLPPLAEQAAIADSLRTVDVKIQSEENRKRSLGALFDSLLHELMTGKLRVEDLEMAEVPVPS